MGARMADDFDLHSHQDTYSGFVKLLTWGLVSVVILLVLLGIFVA
ncbi:MAG: aa3-type cytochrome c oxidase subunit IV [Alphaproteobacteria bacterium]